MSTEKRPDKGDGIMGYIFMLIGGLIASAIVTSFAWNGQVTNARAEYDANMAAVAVELEETQGQLNRTQVLLNSANDEVQFLQRRVESIAEQVAVAAKGLPIGDFCTEYVERLEATIRTNAPGVGPAPAEFIISEYEDCVVVMTATAEFDDSIVVETIEGLQATTTTVAP